MSISLILFDKRESFTSDKKIVINLTSQTGCLLYCKDLYETVSTSLDIRNMDEYQLICFGRRLDHKQPLIAYDIKDSNTVDGTKKYKIKHNNNNSYDNNNGDYNHGKKAKLDEMEIQKKIKTILASLTREQFRSELEKLKHRKNLEYLLNKIKGLGDDPIALSVLNDATILNCIFIADRNNHSKVFAKHPKILEAAVFLAENFQIKYRRIRAQQSSAQPMDLSGSQEGEFEFQPPGLSSSNLPNVTRQPNSSENGSSNRPVSGQQTQLGNNSNLSHNTITSEMLRNALRMTAPGCSSNRLQSTTTRTQAAATPPQSLSLNCSTLAQQLQSNTTNRDSSNSNASHQPDGYQHQLQQMHALGISDDFLSLQALQITNGDVEAAVNLIFQELCDQ